MVGRCPSRPLEERRESALHRAVGEGGEWLPPHFVRAALAQPIGLVRGVARTADHDRWLWCRHVLARRSRRHQLREDLALVLADPFDGGRAGTPFGYVLPVVTSSKKNIQYNCK